MILLGLLAALAAQGETFYPTVSTKGPVNDGEVAVFEGVSGRYVRSGHTNVNAYVANMAETLLGVQVLGSNLWMVMTNQVVQGSNTAAWAMFPALSDVEMGAHGVRLGGVLRTNWAVGETYDLGGLSNRTARLILADAAISNSLSDRVAAERAISNQLNIAGGGASLGALSNAVAMLRTNDAARVAADGAISNRLASLGASDAALSNAVGDLRGATNYLAAFLTNPIVGPQGPAGSNGAVGATGPAGPAGRDGTNGVNGVDGINGTNGMNGADGRDGTNGVNGVDGINGTNGCNGIDGTNGMNGAQGPQGPAGLNGTNGMNGVNGTNGCNGIDGLNGTNGMNGLNGTNGCNGIDGTNGMNGVDGRDGTNGVNGVNGTNGMNGVAFPLAADGDLAGFTVSNGTYFGSGTGVSNLPLNSGFADALSSMVFSNASRTFTLAGNGTRFVTGGKWRSLAGSTNVVLSTNQGAHHVYFDNSGALIDSLSTWPIAGEAQVAEIWWDNVASNALYVSEERHGNVMSDATHKYLHSSFGTRWVSGGSALHNALASGNPAANGSNTVFALTPVTIADEDLTVAIGTGKVFLGTQAGISTTNDGARLAVYYATNTTWARREATMYPFACFTNGLPQYNQLVGGNWRLNQMSTNGGAFVYWIFAGNDVGTNGVFLVPHHTVYPNLAAAQAALPETIFQNRAWDLSDELKLLYRLVFIYGTGAAYVEGNRWSRLSDVVDYRTDVSRPLANAPTTMHGALAGLGNNDHPQYALVTGTELSNVYAATNALTLANLDMVRTNASYTYAAGTVQNFATATMTNKVLWPTGGVSTAWLRSSATNALAVTGIQITGGGPTNYALLMANDNAGATKWAISRSRTLATTTQTTNLAPIVFNCGFRPALIIVRACTSGASVMDWESHIDNGGSIAGFGHFMNGQYYIGQSVAIQLHTTSKYWASTNVAISATGVTFGMGKSGADMITSTVYIVATFIE